MIPMGGKFSLGRKERSVADRRVGARSVPVSSLESHDRVLGQIVVGTQDIMRA